MIMVVDQAGMDVEVAVEEVITETMEWTEDIWVGVETGTLVAIEAVLIINETFAIMEIVWIVTMIIVVEVVWIVEEWIAEEWIVGWTEAVEWNVVAAEWIAVVVEWIVADRIITTAVVMAAVMAVVMAAVMAVEMVITVISTLGNEETIHHAVVCEEVVVEDITPCVINFI